MGPHFGLESKGTLWKVPSTFAGARRTLAPTNVGTDITFAISYIRVHDIYLALGGSKVKRFGKFVYQAFWYQYHPYLFSL
jgi:hypothetical protein